MPRHSATAQSFLVSSHRGREPGARLAVKPALTLAVALAVALTAAVAGLAACSRLTSPPEPEPMTLSPASAASPATPPTATAPAASAAPTAVASAASAASPPEAPLGVVDENVGKGAVAKAGDKVKVQYTGTLTNGTVFDSSRTRNQPFEFILGKGAVIKGWDQGVAGMKVGGKRKLTIPPSLGYGARGAGAKIPPNSTLLFDVELVEIEK